MAKKKVADVSNVPDVAPEPPPPREPARGEVAEAIRKAIEELGGPTDDLKPQAIVDHVKSRFNLEIKKSDASLYKGKAREAAGLPPMRARGAEKSVAPSEPTLSDLVAFRRRMASEGLDLEGLRRKVAEVEALAETVGGFERLKRMLEAYEILSS